MKKHLAVVTAKNSYSFFFSKKKKDKCIIQDDIKRSIFHHYVNGN